MAGVNLQIEKKLRRYYSRFVRFWKKPTQSIAPTPKQLRMYRLFQQDEKFDTHDAIAGFHLVHFREGLEQSWVDVLNESAEFGNWDIAKLSRVLLSDLLPNGGVLIFNDKSKPVACSSVCLKKDFLPFAGLVHVVVLPPYRGHRLSASMIRSGLENSFRLGFPGVALLTDDFRLPAINIYLQLGFVPDKTMSLDASNRWERVFSQLDKYKA